MKFVTQLGRGETWSLEEVQYFTLASIAFANHFDGEIVVEGLSWLVFSLEFVMKLNSRSSLMICALLLTLGVFTHVDFQECRHKESLKMTGK